MSPTQIIHTIQPYLFLDGRTEEALEFYKQAIGAEIIMLLRNSDNPEPAQPGCLPPDSENKIMHAQFRVGDTTVLCSDGRCSGKPVFEGFALTLNVKDEAEADQRFATLADGGEIQMPLAKTFFSPRFGMVKDRFGVWWMVIVPTH
jgi:PhnB protein